MERLRAVIVDDEAHILRSIRRGLRAHISDWDFVFTTKPAEALQDIKSRPPSVVITDRKMLEMDGGAFLCCVKKIAPKAIRVLMSGDMSEKTVITSAELAHILIGKPFEVADLSDVLKRAIALQLLDVDDKQREILGRLKGLPVLPQVYHELTTYLNEEPEPNLDEVVRVIKHDPGITAKLAQVANSSFFGSQHASHDLKVIVMRLGFDLIRQLIVVMSLNQDDHHKHIIEASEPVANEMRALAIQAGKDSSSVEQAYVLGLLHDLGSIVDLESTDPESTDAELVGAYLLTLWGFTQELVQAVMYKLRPMNQTPISPLTCMLNQAILQCAGSELNEIPAKVVECARA